MSYCVRSKENMCMEVCSVKPSCYTTDLKKQKHGPFQNEKFLYLQPRVRLSTKHHRTYKKPTIEIESKTTYNMSYIRPGCVLRTKIYNERREKGIPRNTGKFNFDTVYKLSYEIPNGKLVKPFLPKSCLSISGLHDMTTVHMLSYTYPKYSKTSPCRPFRGKTSTFVAMDDKTIMKESYQNVGIPLRFKQPTAQSWRTKFKTDYQTVTQLSYPRIKPIFKSISKEKQFRPFISAKIENDTTYSTSYQIPGRLINVVY